jgi:hypothetical protein
MKKKLLDITRDKICFKHYSGKTKLNYAGWIKRFILYHKLIAHKSVETTMIYTHIVAEMNKSRVVSPLDM